LPTTCRNKRDGAGWKLGFSEKSSAKKTIYLKSGPKSESLPAVRETTRSSSEKRPEKGDWRWELRREKKKQLQEGGGVHSPPFTKKEGVGALNVPLRI